MGPGLIYAAAGGLLEPVWVWFLARYRIESGVRRIACLALFLAISVASVYWVGVAMRYMNIGVSYAVWSAVGAVTTLAVGRFSLGEGVDRMKILAVCLIVAGIAGLHMFGGAP